MKPALYAARRARGVSLVEALVALAVMAFGMLGVVGMQSTLRSGADQSKQRSEALRLAQERMETLRGFAMLASAPAGEIDFADIQSEAASAVVSSATAGYGGNATFTRIVTVVDAAASSASAPRMKHVEVKVSWADRESDGTAATERSVLLRSSIAKVAPEMGASLGLSTANSAPRRPDGRHVSVPPSAVNQGATSVFTPPGGGGVTWVFSNATGLIVQLCPVSGPCTGPGSALLTGYVRFATGAQPTSAESEAPVDPAVLVTVTVNPTSPGTTTISCYTTSPVAQTYVQYYCAMPLINPFSLIPPDFTWSGTSYVAVNGRALSSIASDVTAINYKVCRYTPDATTDTPAGGNVSHPKVYTFVPGSLVNQNFLVMDAGDGTTAYTCPLDDTGTPLLDGDTRLHQP